MNNFHSETFNSLGDTLSIIDRQVKSDNESQKFNTTLLWKQKFKKRGRTFSLSARQSYNESESTGILLSDNNFFKNGSGTTTHIDQQKLRDNISSGVNARATYTEPLSKRSLLEFNYSIDNNHRKSRIVTLEDTGAIRGKYEHIIDTLSNDYSFNVLTHNGGIAYRYAKPKRLTISFGMNMSKALYTRKDLQTDTLAKYSFTNFYPQANFTWNLGSNGNLRFNYSGNTQAPSIDQIQPIQDNTDQLNIRKGNPNLKQSFRHDLRFSYDSYKFLSERSIYTTFYFNGAQNDFTNINFIDVTTGKNTYQPVNVNGNYSMGNWTYYFKKLKKLNIYVGGTVQGNITRNFNFIDNLKNENRNYSYTVGPTIGYDKEKKWSFRIETRFTRNISKSSLRPELVTKYWMQEHYADLNVYLPWKLEIHTDAGFNFREKTSAFDKSTNNIRWNARIDRKILKKDVARIRFSAFDILDQNIDFNRSTNNNFYSERNYDTMRRYFMLSLIWNFNKNSKPVEE
jgi:hypothetical protein